MTLRLGHAVAICRAARGWTQDELARRARLGPSMLSLVEAGHRQLSLDSVERVAAALDIAPSFTLLLASDEQAVAEAPPQMCAAILRWFQAA